MPTPWTRVGEIMWVAPQVVALRAARMARGGWPPSARDRREYVRMVREKVEAVAEIAAAVLTASPGTVAGKVITPVHRRVMANRRRLTPTPGLLRPRR